MNANIVDHIGEKVTVWTKDGNAMENRKLLTLDDFGIVVEGFMRDKQVFVPWAQVKYVDYSNIPEAHRKIVQSTVKKLLVEKGWNCEELGTENPRPEPENPQPEPGKYVSYRVASFTESNTSTLYNLKALKPGTVIGIYFTTVPLFAAGLASFKTEKPYARLEYLDTTIAGIIVADVPTKETHLIRWKDIHEIVTFEGSNE